MGRRCICKICGAELNTDTAFTGTTLKGNHYYCCSESEYLNYNSEIVSKNNVIDYVFQLCKTNNSALFKEMNVWHETASWSKLENYFRDNIEYLTNVLNSKSFEKIYYKIRYLSAIVKDNIDDYKESAPDIQISASEFIPVNYKPKPKRKGFADIDV